jgi:hypothetical protein
MRMWCARRWLGLLGFVVAVGGVLGGIAPAQQGLIPEELVVGMVPSRARRRSCSPRRGARQARPRLRAEERVQPSEARARCHP